MDLSKLKVRSKKHLILISVFLSAIYLSFNFIILVFFSPPDLKKTIGLEVILMPILVFITISVCTILIDYIVKGLDKLGIAIDNWKRWIIGFIVTLIISATISLSTFKVLPTPPPFDVIESEFQQLIFFFLPNYLFLTVIYTIVEVWNSIQKNKHLQISLAKAEKEKIQSQLSALQQKVNPHFLFNSLSVLSELVYENPIKANAFIEEFTKVYRYVLEFKEEILVSVLKEIEFVNAYIFLQKIRFGDNLKFENRLSKDAFNKKIPPLSLQMLIENALKHNEVSKAKPLYISMNDTGEYLVVTNSIQTRLETPNSTGVGILNLKKTYDLISKTKPEFIKTKTEFIAKLPLIKESH
ncbi:histidine kinase [Croceitalea sp. P059]|uniref:sensor histidine kinase n=1 Tax=Croceitalea sp. P059 TaxID=3075601 RepID=UPI0028849341|nr:histidine kinase [Croceitalea sp. P059]MDT0540711.1 histidine kinase [Croceitalea sp. P059]